MDYKNKFPLEVFPETLSAIIQNRNEVSSWDINALASCFLSASASVIGRNGLIDVEEYDSPVPPLLWIAIVGETGTGKTPMLNLAYKYLNNKHKESLKNSELF